MHHANSGIAFVFLALVLFTAFFGFWFGFPMIANNGASGTPPKISLQENEKLVFVSRMRIEGTEYALWDIRDNKTNIIKFMVLVTPIDGKPVRDADIQSRAFSVRLALQTAFVVKSISDKTKTIQEKAQEITRLGSIAISIAELSGRYSLANDLRSFGALVGEKTEAAVALAGTVEGSTEYANRLINDPDERNADLFLTSLGVSAAVTISQKGVLVYLLISNALKEMNISPGQWLESLYNQLTQGTTPTVLLLQNTFGGYESSQTEIELTARGAY